ncbi:MAG: YfiR family protein [Steroidobacteraceae bacterium]
MRRSALLLASLMAMALASFAPRAWCDDLPEYRLKAAFLYNFALFTDWTADVGPTLNVCVYGQNPFGPEIDGLEGKAVGERLIAVHRLTDLEPLRRCQLVFIADAANGSLPRVLASLHGAPVLTVADSPGAVDQGVALNMSVVNNRITFEANLAAARDAKLSLSSKLLRLATKVRQ